MSLTFGEMTTLTLKLTFWPLQEKEVKLPAGEKSCVIHKCYAGTNHFIRIYAIGTEERLLEKSRQITVQTSAAPDTPVVTLRYGTPTFPCSSLPQNFAHEPMGDNSSVTNSPHHEEWTCFLGIFVLGLSQVKPGHCALFQSLQFPVHSHSMGEACHLWPHAHQWLQGVCEWCGGDRPGAGPVHIFSDQRQVVPGVRVSSAGPDRSWSTPEQAFWAFDSDVAWGAGPCAASSACYQCQCRQGHVGPSRGDRWGPDQTVQGESPFVSLLCKFVCCFVNLGPAWPYFCNLFVTLDYLSHDLDLAGYMYRRTDGPSCSGYQSHSPSNNWSWDS